MKRYLILIFMLIFSSYLAEAAQSITCTGHDACKNKIWNGEYNIYCGASNSERTCKSTTLNCGKDDTCYIETRGSGHDAYQYSTVNAKESSSFKLKCGASGQRDCKSITVWCPQGSGSTCECISCPSTVTFKCVKDISCSSVSNAHVDYVSPDKYTIPDSIWNKDTLNTGKRPDCDKAKINNNNNYLWGTLQSCKKKCLEESTGLCNIISRYGENSKTADELYHCYFYSCKNPDNFTWIDQNQWGNGASTSNTYILPVRHHTLESRYLNVLEYTPYQIKDFGANTCPTNFSQIINKDECQTAQQKVASDKSFQGIPHPEIPVSGCYYDNLHNRVYMPPDSHGTGSNHMAPICKATCETFTNIDAAQPLVDFCINSIPIKSKLQKSSNRTFQIKSWKTGCQKRKDTLAKCKTACNSPQGCCGVTCQSNSCSGGGCCTASRNICKEACTFYFNPVAYNIINVYQNVTNYKNITRFNNFTNYLYKNITNYLYKNITNYLYKNITNYITHYKNKTICNNFTNSVINYLNKTIYQNITNEIVNYIEKTNWINKTIKKIS
jgi:hypothetical protein